MRRKETWVLSACAGIVAVCAVYMMHLSAPYYYPLERVWRWERVPDAPAMSWYARSAWAILAGGVTFALSAALFSQLRDPLQEHTRRRVALAATCITLAAIAFALGDTIVHEYRAWMR